MKYSHRPLAFPILPHVVECREDRHLLHSLFVVKDEVKDWLNATVGDGNWKMGKSYVTLFCFATEEQAVLFKLTWS